MNRALFQTLFPLPCHATRGKNTLFWRLVTQQETRIRYSSALSRDKGQDDAPERKAASDGIGNRKNDKYIA